MSWAFNREQALVIVWVLFFAALACISARLIARMRIFPRLLLDDYLAVLALFCLLTINLIFTITLPVFDISQNVAYYHHKPPPNYENIAATFEKLQWAIAYVYFTGLWAVKSVFLVCYEKLTKELKYFRQAWYVLLVYVVLTYVGCLIAYPLLNWNQHAHSGAFRSMAIRYQFAVDLTTDLFIAALPISLALRVTLPLNRKLALAAVFAQSLLATIIAIVRFAVDDPSGHAYGAIWLSVWSTIELSVAVSVASAVVLRTLVVRGRCDRAGYSGVGSGDTYTFRCKGVPLGSLRMGTRHESVQFDLLQQPEEARVKDVPSSRYFNSGTNSFKIVDEYGVLMI